MNTVLIRHWGGATIMAGMLAGVIALSGCGATAQESTVAETTASTTTTQSVAAAHATAPEEGDITTTDTLEDSTDGGSYATDGTGSPAVYSTADITVTNADLTSTASQGVVAEGKNPVTLNNVTLTASNTKEKSDKSGN